MNQGLDTVIVSVFGRGNWLAAELADRGFKVALVDVSGEMGRWTPEDWEGPFGFFRSENLSPLQIARLHEEDYEDSIPDGFSVWLKGGPIDFTGPISNFLLEKSGIAPVCFDYIMNYDSMSVEERKKKLKEVKALSFSENWIVQLAHQLASSVICENTEALDRARPLPLFAPYSIRRLSRRGAQRSLDWLREKGVEVYSESSLQDISFEGQMCTGIEVRSQGTGRISADRFVWMLTSEESMRFSRVAHHLYPSGPVEADWVWIRYRMQIKENEMMNSVPDKFVMLEEVELSWVHENLSLVQKSVSPLDWDVWVRIPAQHRFRRSYLEELGDKLLRIIEARIPKSEPTILDMPQDFHYDESEIGPSRQPIYSAEKLASLDRRVLKNFYFDSPENWELLDWTGQFQSQNQLCEQIIKAKFKEKPSGSKSDD